EFVPFLHHTTAFCALPQPAQSCRSALSLQRSIPEPPCPLRAQGVMHPTMHSRTTYAVVCAHPCTKARLRTAKSQTVVGGREACRNLVHKRLQWQCGIALAPGGGSDAHACRCGGGERLGAGPCCG